MGVTWKVVPRGRYLFVRSSGNLVLSGFVMPRWKKVRCVDPCLHGCRVIKLITTVEIIYQCNRSVRIKGTPSLELFVVEFWGELCC